MRMSVIALAAGALVAASMPVSAQRSFDGNWSVSIITEKGGCDQGYKYDLRISGGNVSVAEGAVSGSGKVDGNGRVNVRIAGGGASASGSGRLSGNSGGGTWRGGGSNGECSGRWQAERRA